MLESWKHFLAYSFLFLVALTARSLFTEPIEAGGDAIQKWTAAVNFDGNPKRLLKNHHTMRWSVMGPGILCHRIFGNSPVSYYIAPLLAYCLGYVLLLRIAASMMPWGRLVIFAAVLFFEPMMFRASSQFQPIAFGFAYLICSYTCLDIWLASEKRLWFVFSAVFLFCAYGAKVPYLYFLPGLMLFLWQQKGTFTVVAYSALLYGCFLIEWAVFNSLSEDPLLLGRVSALAHSHRPGTTAGAASNFVQYFTMWTKLSPLNWVVTVIPLCFLGHIFRVESESGISRHTTAFSFMAVSYILLNTFLIVDPKTMLTSQPPLVRYLAIIMPFLCFISCGCISELFSVTNTPTAKRWQARFLFAALLSPLIAQFILGGGAKYWHNGITYPRPSAFAYRVDRHYQTAAEWLKAGNVIMTRSRINAEAIKTLLKAHLESDSISMICIEHGHHKIWIEQLIRETPQSQEYNFSQVSFGEPS